MENVLKAKIIADITDYKAKMLQVEKVTEQATKEKVQLREALKSLDKQYKAGTIDLDTYSKRLAKINTELANQRQTISNAGRSFQALSGNIGSANGVAIEFNRIIQDAPFGVIGIGNNIQQLASNFGTLSTQVGGTGKALSLSLKSLVSGINPYLIAFNALTTALTLYSMGAFGAKEETNLFEEALEDLQDTAEETARKLTALKFLDKKIFEEYDKVLKEAGKGYNLFSMTVEERTNAINRAIGSLTKDQLEALKSAIGERIGDLLRKQSLEVDKTSRSFQDAENSIKEYRFQLSIIDKQLEFYSDKTKKAKKDTKDFGDAIDENIMKVELQNKMMADAAKALAFLSEAYLKQVEGPEFKPIDIKIQYNPESIDKLSEDQQKIIDDLVAFQTKVNQLNQDAAKFLRDGLTNMVADTAFAFGEALANGDNAIAAAGKAILGAFGNFLGQFGRLLVQYGLAGKTYAVLTKALLNPLTAGPAAVAAIAVGAALIAISGAISGALRGGATTGSIGGGSQTGDLFTNMPRREFGGPVRAGQSYLVGEKRAEVFIPQTNGIILPSLDSYAASMSQVNMKGAASQRIVVEVVGAIENDQIRLSNKYAINKVNRT